MCDSAQIKTQRAKFLIPTQPCAEGEQRSINTGESCMLEGTNRVARARNCSNMRTMRRKIIVCVVSASLSVLLLSAVAQPQKASVESPLPNEFVIARHTFIDVGPPNDFYELFIARPGPGGTLIERITLVPPGDICIAPAKFEDESVPVDKSPAELLGSTNPCTIPEEELRRELERRKKYLVFSGADVVMQVKCGSKTRLIRSDILDRDMFDPAAKTPKHTSWTMSVLQMMESSVGPGAAETQPLLSIPGADDAPQIASNSGIIPDLSAGKYDALFQGAPDKPSDLYRASQMPSPVPKVELVSSILLNRKCLSNLGTHPSQERRT